MLQLLLLISFFVAYNSLGSRRKLFWLVKLRVSDSTLNVRLENN